MQGASRSPTRADVCISPAAHVAAGTAFRQLDEAVSNM